MAGDEKKKPGKKIITKKGNKYLKCDLSEKEMLQAGEDMAQGQKEVVATENELASIQKQYKTKISEAELKRDKAANLIRDKFEFREIETEIVMDYPSGMVTVTRLDLNTVCEARKMTEEEKQMPLEV